MFIVLYFVVLYDVVLPLCGEIKITIASIRSVVDFLISQTLEELSLIEDRGPTDCVTHTRRSRLYHWPCSRHVAPLAALVRS